MKLEQHLTVDSTNSNMVDLLHQQTSLSKAKIKQAMTQGAVWLTRNNSTKRIRRSKTQLLDDDQLHLYYDEKILQQTPEAPQLIADCAHYSAWYKPYGVYSQGSKWGDHCSITRLTEIALQRQSYLVHRLDRATTGLILVAHNKKSARQLSTLFAERQIKKCYQAIVSGEVKALSQQPEQALTIQSEIDGRKAISHIRQLSVTANRQHSLIEIRIDTGRKHQIRRHLAELGHPIIGDRLYGKDHSTNLQLCAVSLTFHCPINDQDRDFQLPDNLRLL